MKIFFYSLSVLSLAMTLGNSPAHANLQEFYNSPLHTRITQYEKKNLRRNIEIVGEMKAELASSSRVPLDDCCTFGYRVNHGLLAFVGSVWGGGALYLGVNSIPEAITIESSLRASETNDIHRELVEYGKTRDDFLSKIKTISQDLSEIHSKPDQSLLDIFGDKFPKEAQALREAIEKRTLAEKAKASYLLSALRMMWQNKGATAAIGIATIGASVALIEGWKALAPQRYTTVSEEEKLELEDFLNNLEQDLKLLEAEIQE